MITFIKKDCDSFEYRSFSPFGRYLFKNIEITSTNPITPRVKWEAIIKVIIDKLKVFEKAEQQAVGW